MNTSLDEKQLRSWWDVFNPQNKLVEIRLLGNNTYSGYFTDVDTLVSRLKPLLAEENAKYYGNLQAYFTLNEINTDLYSREQRDMFVKKPKSTTTDGDIVRRRFVLIDLDPNRAAGISASNEEFERAHIKAVAVYRYLIQEGFKEPIITKSGNGYHVYVTCDMPNDDAHTELVKRFLQSLGKMFSDDGVEIDEKVYNAARIDKLIGTWAKKGANCAERPWRLATIVKVPSDLTANDETLFQRIVDLLPKEAPKQAPNRPARTYNTPFDLRTWLHTYNVTYREESQGANTKFILEECPWCDTHSTKTKWDSALFQNADGQITFSCFHSHCKDKTWFDVRTLYEPDAYARPAYQPQQVQYRQYLPQVPTKPKYEIKAEVPELGKKWLKMSQIEKLDISSIEGVKTGFTELDKALVKLHYGEVTLVSGSNAAGKSSWLNTLILNIANQDVPVALWSGELPERVLKAWIQMPAAGRNHLLPSRYGDGKFYVTSDVGAQIDEWLDEWLLIYNSEYGSQWEQLFADMLEVVEAGVKVLVLDNLMSMNIDLIEGSKNEKQSKVMLAIKKFAKDNNVHIILVAHPRKSMAFLRKNDISGTADITNVVDNVLILHRVNEDFLHAVTEFYDAGRANALRGYGNVIVVEKNRLFGVVDLMIGLHYEIESRRFKNTPDEYVHYKWEHNATQSTMDLRPQDQPAKVDEKYPWDDMTPTNEVPF